MNLRKPLFYSLILLAFVACQAPQSTDATDTTAADTTATKDTVAQGEKSKHITPDTIHALDVSHFQGTVDWASVKAGGIHLGICKATEGVTYVDPMFATNWASLAENEMYRGAYHFYVASDDPTEQALAFIKTVKTLGVYHLPPVIDAEVVDDKSISVEQYQENVQLWLKIVEDSLGVQPMIYTNHPFGNEYLNNEVFGKYRLWLAEYQVDEAHTPEAWKTTGWSGWQYTQHGTFPGVEGAVDESRFLKTILMNVE